MKINSKNLAITFGCCYSYITGAIKRQTKKTNKLKGKKMKAEYIKKATLSFPNLWSDLGLSKDNGGRWFAGTGSPEFVREYCSHYRTPSRAWPMSHAKPLLSQKFAQALCENMPELAIKCGVGVVLQD